MSATQITIRTTALKLPSQEALAVTGSCPELGNWEYAVIMDEVNPVFRELTFDVCETFEYKFVIADVNTSQIRAWEDGWNRLSGDIFEGKTIFASSPRFETGKWKGAGVAIPVFSLRTQDSFGVGEFNDLKKLADWAELTGQTIIQLLPVNDTTTLGTKEDSYPYSAVSAFALHPQFIHLPDAGVVEDEAFGALQNELNALEYVDYERVNAQKTRLLKQAFEREGKKTFATKAYKEFFKSNRYWLTPYSAFRVLTALKGTADFSTWGGFAKYDETAVVAFCKKHSNEVGFHYFEQYHLYRQLAEVKAYAQERGVMLKGDLPIGISRTSADAWQNPELYNLDSQAGAPPDAFSTAGQNWGFPTYNWEKMSEDGYKWWKQRLGKMSEGFDAFRIDHILGFFRIWEIQSSASNALLGHFNPALPYSANELKGLGFDISGGKYIVPIMKDDDVLFVEDPRKEGFYHPRIAAQYTFAYNCLEQWQKDAFNRLYDDFFYHRHNAFWKESAYKKLPELISATGMLVCGEDLGMIPESVPETMRELQILSLEIQRMPKSQYETFADTQNYPYLSVCATSTHDITPIRAWWNEDRALTQRYYNEMLGNEGEAPQDCEPWICRQIVEQHLRSTSMLAILPLQDWLSLSGQLRHPEPEKERINVPSIPRYYWRYRMHLTVEQLIAANEFNAELRNMIARSGR